MEINKLVFGGLLVGCLAAAGVGGYLAMRQNGTTPASAAPAPADPSLAPDAAEPVTASEGVIAPEEDAAPPAPAKLAPPAPAPEKPAPPRRTEAPRRARTTPSRPTAPPASQTAQQSPTSTPAPGNGSMWEPRPAIEPVAPAPEEPAEPPAPPAPELVDLVIPSDSVLGLQVERAVSSETARVEDRVEARVTRDVRVDGQVAIPAGAIVQGSVTDVDQGGKVRERARLAVRFHTVVLADGTRLSIRTDAITREGRSPSGESTAKIGGAAAGGAILGAILGGGKGAAIGGGAGTGVVLATRGKEVTVPAGTSVSTKLLEPVVVRVRVN